MNPEHHPELDELLLYASGGATEWISLVVATHLTYCAECRREVSLLEDLGGALLDAAPPDTDETAGTRTAPEPTAAQPSLRTDKSSSRTDAPSHIPRTLYPYFADEPRFRFLVPGVQHIPLSFSVNGIPARIVKFKAGFTIPEHRHTGLEMVLVLDGVIEDTATREVFRTGDLSRREDGSIHGQHVPQPSGPCICLVVSEAPIVPSTVWGRFLKAVSGV